MEKCLTLFPHWAWAVIYGGKRIENRTWNTKHRGRLWIHSASRLRCPSHEDMLLLPSMPDAAALTTRAIIGYVSLVDVVTLREASGDVFATGPFCWVLQGAVAIDPLPCAGQMGLWTVPLRVVRAARRIRSSP